MSKYLQLMTEVTREQASIISKGKSDAAVAIRELNRRGNVQYEGVFYTIKYEDGRYLASIDNPIGVHGFYGAPTKHAAMEWLVRRICPDVLPLCTSCHEHKSEEGQSECWACEDRRTEAALDAWNDRCERAGGDDE